MYIPQDFQFTLFFGMWPLTVFAVTYGFFILKLVILNSSCHYGCMILAYYFIQEPFFQLNLVYLQFNVVETDISRKAVCSEKLRSSAHNVCHWSEVLHIANSQQMAEISFKHYNYTTFNFKATLAANAFVVIFDIKLSQHKL